MCSRVERTGVSLHINLLKAHCDKHHHHQQFMEPRTNKKRSGSTVEFCEVSQEEFRQKNTKGDLHCNDNDEETTTKMIYGEQGCCNDNKRSHSDAMCIDTNTGYYHNEEDTAQKITCGRNQPLHETVRTEGTLPPSMVNEWLNNVRHHLQFTQTPHLSVALISPMEYRNMEELGTSLLLDGSDMALRMGVGMFGAGANFGIASLALGSQHILTTGSCGVTEELCMYVWPGNAHDCDEFLDRDLSERSRQIGPLSGQWNESNLTMLLQKLSEIVKNSGEGVSKKRKSS